MQTKKYRLQTEMENLNIANEEWFKDYLRQVLESDKSYFEKADYIAYSIIQIQKKIEYITDEIKELQTIKKNLATSKEIALELTASVLAEYGIEKLEGATVSSITITPEKSSITQQIAIKDPTALMALGYVSFSVDEIAIANAIKTNEGLDELKGFISVLSVTENIPAKVKINQKRSANNTTVADVDEILTLSNNQAA